MKKTIIFLLLMNLNITYLYALATKSVMSISTRIIPIYPHTSIGEAYTVKLLPVSSLNAINPLFKLIPTTKFKSLGTFMYYYPAIAEHKELNFTVLYPRINNKNLDKEIFEKLTNSLMSALVIYEINLAELKQENEGLNYADYFSFDALRFFEYYKGLNTAAYFDKKNNKFLIDLKFFIGEKPLIYWYIFLYEMLKLTYKNEKLTELDLNLLTIKLYKKIFPYDYNLKKLIENIIKLEKNGLIQRDYISYSEVLNSYVYDIDSFKDLMEEYILLSKNA